MKADRQAAFIGPDGLAALRAVLDALPLACVLSTRSGERVHANAAGGLLQESEVRHRIALHLTDYGECVLLLGSAPVDAQTQRLASLGFMLAGACHEVSNPLAAVSSMLQILQSKRGVSAETMQKGIASIAANVARVLAITRKLGGFSRAGDAAPGPLAIDEAVEAAAAVLRHTGFGQGVQVDYRGPRAAKVLARPAELQQVLFNILLNAAQAMEGAGRVEALAARRDGCLVLTLRDTGPGIREAHLARVFDPFFTTKAPGEGTGLGLALSYEIVQELGGALRALNHPDGGACLELTLPAA